MLLSSTPLLVSVRVKFVDPVGNLSVLLLGITKYPSSIPALLDLRSRRASEAAVNTCAGVLSKKSILFCSKLLVL